VKTIEAACVQTHELDQLDTVVRQLPKDSHLGAALADMAYTVRKGGDIFIAWPGDRISPAKAAKVLGMSRTHLYKVMDAGDLPYIEVGRDRRISLDDLRAFDQRRDEVRKDLAERFARPSEVRSAALDNLVEGGGAASA
jgi:excisionase family DNA binding protein